MKPADQEKTTFTCPYGTYAYKRMPFGLCNAPTTFQCCMIAIFQDMLETSKEVFMDDFSVFRDSFETCHKVSSAGFKVDKAKIDVIAKHPPPTNVKAIKNKKGAENVAAYHLSRPENLNQEKLRDEDIDDNFLDETLMNVLSNDEE
ncbi:hypothetical protein Tco_0724059 [Tanacetum coccineum]